MQKGYNESCISLYVIRGWQCIIHGATNSIQLQNFVRSKAMVVLWSGKFLLASQPLCAPCSNNCTYRPYEKTDCNAAHPFSRIMLVRVGLFGQLWAYPGLQDWKHNPADACANELRNGCVNILIQIRSISEYSHIYTRLCLQECQNISQIARQWTMCA